MAINSKRVKKEGQAPKLSVLIKVNTTIPKGIFETEAQKMNTRLVKLIANR